MLTIHIICMIPNFYILTPDYCHFDTQLLRVFVTKIYISVESFCNFLSLAFPCKFQLTESMFKCLFCYRSSNYAMCCMSYYINVNDIFLADKVRLGSTFEDQCTLSCLSDFPPHHFITPGCHADALNHLYTNQSWLHSDPDHHHDLLRAEPAFVITVMLAAKQGLQSWQTISNL